MIFALRCCNADFGHPNGVALWLEIAIISAHMRKGSYCETLAKAYWRDGRAGGHDATLFAPSAMIFDPVQREASGYRNWSRTSNRPTAQFLPRRLDLTAEPWRNRASCDCNGVMSFH